MSQSISYTKTSEGLKDCPCCGCRAEYEYGPDDETGCDVETLQCTQCPLRMNPQYHSRGYQRERLYAAWNQRDGQ